MKKLIVIVGPTAVGKTRIAIELASKLKTEIVSADSRQIYKELNIGVARPSVEELQTVRHHFIACKSVVGYYNASMFENEALEVIENLFKKNDNVIVVGGSGLYIDALLYGIDDLPTIDLEIRNKLQKIFEKEGLTAIQEMLRKLDEKSYNNIDLKNPKRILKCLEITIQTGRPYSTLITGQKKQRNFDINLFFINLPRQILYDIIDKRVEKMIEYGLVDEVRNLSMFRDYTPLKTIGYAEIFDFLDNKISIEQAIEQIKFNTHKYARKQISWFRRYKNAILIENDTTTNIADIIQKHLNI